MQWPEPLLSAKEWRRDQDFGGSGKLEKAILLLELAQSISKRMGCPPHDPRRDRWDALAMQGAGLGSARNKLFV